MFAVLIALFLVPMYSGEFATVIGKSWFQMTGLTLFLWLIISICNKLTDIFILRKQESGLTWCQIAILIAVALWILGFLLVFDIQKDSSYFLVFGITLTTVTILNWDTTTSSIPTSVLHSDHFINFQKMAEGKTYGRLLTKNFILDMSRFRPISAEEAERLKNMDELKHILPAEEIHEGVLNAHLFRTYLFHWLMNDPVVSQNPRLMVSWKEQKDSGMPLQVFAHLLKTGFSTFEWEQSRITEHIVESLEWFGLRLYQSPSSYDLSTCIDHLKEATNRKENIA